MAVPSIRTGGLEIASQAAEVISRSFTTSVLSSFFLRTPTSTWPGTQVPYELIIEHFRDAIPEKVRLGAVLAEADNFAAVALWFPPSGTEHGDDDEANARIHRYSLQVQEVKNRWLQGRPYWYLNLIGRDPGRTEKGVVRALIDPYLRKAQESRVPVWLEAVDEHSRDVYAHLGFRVVEEIRVGVGEFNPRGEFEAGGTGIPLYAMMSE
ncbi:hypothetical protein BO82DRAFT_336837 [Aspergillus uvarum CBS 121591]|uniref:N-acetyltransferase domain-containing protein n=1 Tax=Aspergillus uvarum CBS 121591 TaxID=1448315 RepID=A0A319CBP0_9EURO|nr:hypothetical protein BO82DRAFT_336837 [Aspergillus uvarum CBS 121591]PYH80947.1 hypothetical protein BO82DRAFT_336837 [Aspergillus uvarum CBS 121591]